MSPDSQGVLGFVVDGPLQSWGSASRFQHRATNHHPSKSALAGMIAAALGLAKGSEAERAGLAALSKLRLATVLIPRDTRWKPDDGSDYQPRTVRRLRDYHTVGGGYEKDVDPLHLPRRASGDAGGTVLTTREFLLDARFAVLWSGDAATLERIAAALRDPVWGIWFGRKCCVPATPVAPVIGESLAEVFGVLLRQAGLPELPLERFEREEETTEIDLADAGFDDQPVSFGDGLNSGVGGRAFGLRRVRLHRPSNG